MNNGENCRDEPARVGHRIKSYGEVGYCGQIRAIMKISYSFGVMDLFHYGHLKGLQEAAKDADLHIVGLVSDKAAKAWLENVVSNESERRAVLESIKCVDQVMPQETLDPTEWELGNIQNSLLWFRLLRAIPLSKRGRMRAICNRYPHLRDLWHLLPKFGMVVGD